ncbi:MAG TPA: glycosyltransferase family 9 protein [Candidatus Dormibacteraeota bacterium]|nr:glycosyltransferase family 9 protein [Candidatus Dormibacteraeota bacterium]
MNVRGLQQADRWLGVPLCAAMTLLRPLFDRSRGAGRRPRNILIVKLAEQGSTVLAYPALRRAAELVGRKNLYFIALEDNRFVLDILDVLPRENVITVSKKGGLAFALSILKAIRRLRSLRLEAVVDMEFFSRGSAALAYATGARMRVGFHSFFAEGPYRGNLMTHRLLYNPHLHTSETFQVLVEALRHDPELLPTIDVKAPPDHELPQLAPTLDEVAIVQEMLREETGGQPPLVLINANASDMLPLRRWQLERYAELAGRLLARYPELHIAFTGATDEAAAAVKLKQSVGSSRCFSLAGKTTLRELLVLYTLADVLVTNDSGPAHFATLTPIEVVTLFGPETPRLFGARTPRNTVLWAGIACSPCVSAYNNRQSTCRDNRCMQAISVDLVFETVCEAYERKCEKVAALAI